MWGRAANLRRWLWLARRLGAIGTLVALLIAAVWLIGLVEPPDAFRSPLARALVAANVTFLGFLVWSTARIVLETERARIRLQDAIRSRDEVLAIVSHDLRNLISPIQMSAALIERSATDQGVLRKSRLILRSTGKMEALIQDLLDLAALDRRELRVKLGSCSATEIGREAVELQSGVALDRGIVLVCGIPAELPPIRCDRERILQVFANLLGNALKFTPAGGRVEVAARVLEGRVLYSVADTGPGLDPCQAARIFERHVRGDVDQAGVGLGLFISQRLIEAHGGSIEVDTAPGRGCVFSFALPLADASASATSETAARLT